MSWFYLLVMSRPQPDYQRLSNVRCFSHTIALSSNGSSTVFFDTDSDTDSERTKFQIISFLSDSWFMVGARFIAYAWSLDHAP